MERNGESKAVPLFTVGYGSSGIDQFLDLIKRFDIAYLLDVRSKPYSKYKPEFSREALGRRVEVEGIRYAFMGDLLGGLPKDRSCYTDGKVDYEKVRAQPFYQHGIERLRSAWEQQLRVALLCACGKPERCHRSKLVGVSLQREGIPVVHLDNRGRSFKHEAVIMKLNGNPDLFGHIAEAATSRKKYIYE